MVALSDISGVGEKTITLFHKLGIFDVDDLVTYYPRRYDVIRRTDMKNVLPGERVILDGILDGNPTMVTLSGRLKKIMFRVVNEENIYSIVAFNQAYLCRELHYGMEVTVIGKFEKKYKGIVAQEVRLGRLPAKSQIEAIYYTTDGLNRKVIGRAIHEVLERGIELSDYIPNYLRERYHFPDKLWSIKEIHHPSDTVSFRRALQRLKYEELFLYLMKIQYLKRSREMDDQAISRNLDWEKVEDFIESLSFELTEDQRQTVLEIREDLTSPKRMNRLVQGDVGSGKTIVAFLATYMNFLAGYQTAFMVPTSILANQHYQSAMDLFGKVGMRIAILTSSIRKVEREHIYRKLGTGEIDLVIGTQSLIQEGVTFFNLGLIITDEQHRFGVHQREQLKNKGIIPDVLSMSATPIPRTYALTIYGDMDVSSIKTKPKGRKEVLTYFKEEKKITEVLYLMKRELDLGHQIYVIAPAIEDGNDDLNNVLLLKEKMILAFGKMVQVGMVHGKMKNDEKSKVMQDFEEGKVKILISTTVIEVGVNVPNASMIVIFQANLFGLSTLHQLRGRVGRGSIQSYCILVAKEYSERLGMLEHTSDGFCISEYDFKTRGEGDLFGVRQSGEAMLKLASIKKDFALLVRVKKDVDELMKEHQEEISSDLKVTLMEFQS